MANQVIWWCSLKGISDPKDLTLSVLSNLLGQHQEDIYFHAREEPGSYLVESYSNWTAPTDAIAALLSKLNAANPEVKATLEWAELANAGAGVYTLTPGRPTKEVLYIPLWETFVSGRWDHVNYKHLKQYLNDMCE